MAKSCPYPKVPRREGEAEDKREAGSNREPTSAAGKVAQIEAKDGQQGVKELREKLQEAKLKEAGLTVPQQTCTRWPCLTRGSPSWVPLCLWRWR